MVPFQQLDLVTALQGVGQALANVASAADKDALVRFYQRLELTHDRLDVVGRSNEEYLITVLNYCVSFGHDCPVFPENCRHPGIDLGHVGAQVRQLMAHQRPALRGADGHQTGQPLGELKHLQGAGVFDQPGNVLGHQVLGADQNVDREAAETV